MPRNQLHLRLLSLCRRQLVLHSLLLGCCGPPALLRHPLQDMDVPSRHVPRLRRPRPGLHRSSHATPKPLQPSWLPDPNLLPDPRSGVQLGRHLPRTEAYHAVLWPGVLAHSTPLVHVDLYRG